MRAIKSMKLFQILTIAFLLSIVCVVFSHPAPTDLPDPQCQCNDGSWGSSCCGNPGGNSGGDIPDPDPECQCNDGSWGSSCCGNPGGNPGGDIPDPDPECQCNDGSWGSSCCGN